eukprot:755108-Hanusia_phi.AAC.1
MGSRKPCQVEISPSLWSGQGLGLERAGTLVHCSTGVWAARAVAGGACWVGRGRPAGGRPRCGGGPAGRSEGAMTAARLSEGAAVMQGGGKACLNGGVTECH